MSEAAQYKHRPLPVMAYQMDARAMSHVWAFDWSASTDPFNVVVARRPHFWKPPVPMIETLDGWKEVKPYNWVVRDLVSGRCTVMSDDAFRNAYEG